MKQNKQKCVCLRTEVSGEIGSAWAELIKGAVWLETWDQSVSRTYKGRSVIGNLRPEQVWWVAEKSFF